VNTADGGNWVELGDLSELSDGQVRAFPDLGCFGVVVCRVAGALHAIDDNCSHADTPLSEGRLRGTTIVCPLHGAQFDVRDGRHLCPPAWEGVVAYQVIEEQGAARVDLTRACSPGASNREVGGRFETR
jgi:3-phenylpropionate/trans-cinnamate dioxygenase ferredoxin subunit